MPIKGGTRSITFKPSGASDALDGTNAPPGSMAALTNLIPSQSMKNAFVPRPASSLLFQVISGTSTAIISCLLVVGDIIYGMVSLGTKDTPFVYQISTNSLLQVLNFVGNSILPDTQPTTGPWTPPMMAIIGTKVMIVHPGYASQGAIACGFMDFSNFQGTAVVNFLGGVDITSSTNVVNLGWTTGMTISGTGIPAQTQIVEINTAGTVIQVNASLGVASGVTVTVTGGKPTQLIYYVLTKQELGINSPGIPVCVANFNGRAYYGFSASLLFTDSLNPTHMSNADQILTIANGLPITALVSVPLVSTTVGGVIQSLAAFQGAANMIQVTGDPVTNNLQLNNIAIGVGTLAPNSIAGTPQGVAFVAPDGLRFISQTGQVTPVAGLQGEGVAVPFQSAVNPSRMSAAYSADTLRITVQNGAKSGSPMEDYWLNLQSGNWTGPHSFPFSLSSAAVIGQANTFVTVPTVAVTGVPVGTGVYNSPALPFPGQSTTEGGFPMGFTWQTQLLPDNEAMTASCVCEANISIQMPSGSSVQFQVTADDGNTLDAITITPPNTLGVMQQIPLKATSPWVFKQATLEVSGFLSNLTQVGNVYLSVEELGYSLAGSEL